MGKAMRKGHYIHQMWEEADLDFNQKWGERDGEREHPDFMLFDGIWGWLNLLCARCLSGWEN